MKSKSRGVFILCLIWAVCGQAQTTQPSPAGGPMVGKWKLNLAKSDFGGAPKPGGTIIEVTSASPEMVKWTTTFTAANGMSFVMTYAAPADGKDHAADGTATTYAYTIDGASVTEIQKDSDGTVTTGTFTVKVSGKSKTGTWNYTVKDPQGNETHQTEVFDQVA